MANDPEFEALASEFYGEPAPKPRFLARAGNVALIVYVNIGGLSVPYWIWQSAQGVSFFDWLLERLPWVPLKAVLWPVFVFIEWF